MKKNLLTAFLSLAFISFLSNSTTLAATLVESQPFSVPNTSISNLSFAPFNPALGTLESFKLALALSYNGTLDIGPLETGTLTLSVNAPQLSLSRNDTEDCGVFSSCNEHVAGSFNSSQFFVNPYLGVGTTNVTLSALTEGDMSGSWNGDVELQYRYLPAGGGPLTTIDQQNIFNRSLNGSFDNFNFNVNTFDPGLGDLVEVVLTIDSNHFGSVDTSFSEDANILFFVGAPLLSFSQQLNVGGVCGSLFGCDDSFGGSFDNSTSFEDAYLGAAPIAVTLDSNADQSYTGSWSGSISITYQFLPAIVPEPSSLLLACLGLFGTHTLRRRRS